MITLLLILTLLGGCIYFGIRNYQLTRLLETYERENKIMDAVFIQYARQEGVTILDEKI